ncbi:HAD family hydrolase [Thermoflavimicrobium dichotomicum]|uniref:Haloacid dehalogenase superfamily, subfamily IA, variant 1 with third motif having Dx(3-4)D or Dx(3-4)E n=1 Tax=Thermoflavimicrobium dichotomicum TaxID=46223 RepID=A0A1I3QU13_9BACL|nr:HAD hydrolase-like protein [Thermoflavimicrobium dichotomicum]SFJ36942.1 haloacid dehalogenase superfamily, subfamily IA, variant 1 with third motif having Dx(3-4)D or Dx(3-4)E [Thermoflavimicrobium dichotomicum]
MRAIFFDLDGTLFQTEKIAVPAFQQAFIWLKEQGEYDGEIPTEADILSVTGMTIEQLWAHLLPNATEEMKERMNQKALEIELKLINEGKGELYPKTEETLVQLRERGWTLFIASNGLGPYVHGVLEATGILPLFQDIYAAGEHQTRSKVDLVRKCIQQYDVTEGYMVGDRSSDVEAGKMNQLKVIGCRYTEFPKFGSLDELKEADYKIGAFDELLQVIRP